MVMRVEIIEEGHPNGTDLVVMGGQTEPVVCSVCRQEALHPEFRGTTWGKKDGSGVWFSYCATLIDIAGGYDRLVADWEIKEPRRG